MFYLGCPDTLKYIWIHIPTSLISIFEVENSFLTRGRWWNLFIIAEKGGGVSHFLFSDDCRQRSGRFENPRIRLTSYVNSPLSIAYSCTIFSVFHSTLWKHLLGRCWVTERRLFPPRIFQRLNPFTILNALAESSAPFAPPAVLSHQTHLKRNWDWYQTVSNGVSLLHSRLPFQPDW